VDIDLALKRYEQNRRNALARGVRWKLTFQEWFEFWGDDIDKRGCFRNQLVMMRYEDKGDYELGNIFKGSQSQNCKTMHNMRTSNRVAAWKEKRSHNTLPEPELTMEQEIRLALGYAQHDYLTLDQGRSASV
jgi:hypothetical protein